MTQSTKTLATFATGMRAASLIAVVERWLEVRGWKRTVNYGGEVSYISVSSEWAVELNGDYMSICKFTDGDIDGVAVGRYETEGEECSTLDELRNEMYSVGAMPFECPNCGEAGGAPVTKTTREFQGCREHGGMVEMDEERCTLCVGRA